jgi:hypothetical protein
MKEKALRILLVEDNAGDVRLLREMFSKGARLHFRTESLERPKRPDMGEFRL